MSSKNLIQIDHDACIFCRKCVRACPVSALKAEDRKIVVTEDCNLCTMCIGACPVGAIRMQRPTGKKAGGSIWVFVQCEDGHPLSVSLELIGRARELADGNGGEVIALVMEDGNPQFLQELIAHGADCVLCCSSRGSTGRQQVPESNVGIDRPQVAGEDFGNDRNQAAGADIASDPEAVALWVCELIKKREPDILLFGATLFGREVAPAVAARIGTGLTADCTGLELDPESGLLLQTRPAFGGNLMATIMCPDHRPQMATVRAGVFPVGSSDPDRKGIVETVPFPEAFRPRRITEKLSGEQTDGYDITAMEKLVVVGRGIGSKKNLPLMREFARKIGAGLGCSRPLVEAGWCEYSHQVGQTGHSVAPKLLISVGVSGAVQHLAGIAGAEKIIAINNDEKAPIFRVADYAVVGDCIEIIKAFLEQ